MILVLNAGSLSFKYKIFSSGLKEVKFGQIKTKKGKLKEELLSLKEDYQIDLIGHRVVHGGRKYFKPTKINKQLIADLEEIVSLAPLHNPYNLQGIKTARKVWSQVPQIAFFDTGFYQNLPDKSRYYAIPSPWREKFPRFGFHGLSHEYAISEAAQRLNKDVNNFRAISCHLGGGASVTAFEKGRAVDTSMGLSPVEGLVMMSRSGDVDPTVVLKITKELGFNKAEELFNQKSGMKGLCQSVNMKEILDKAGSGRKKFSQALNIYIYRIQKYIGGYFFALGGKLDTLIFTGAIGAGDSRTKEKILQGLERLLDKVEILVIKSNEEKLIAQKLNNDG